MEDGTKTRDAGVLEKGYENRFSKRQEEFALDSKGTGGDPVAVRSAQELELTEFD